jgi:hypothetical protein
MATFRSAALPSRPERSGKLGIAMTTQSPHATVAAEATPALSSERNAPRATRQSIVRRRFVFTTFPFAAVRESGYRSRVISIGQNGDMFVPHASDAAV